MPRKKTREELVRDLTKTKRKAMNTLRMFQVKWFCALQLTNLVPSLFTA